MDAKRKKHEYLDTQSVFFGVFITAATGLLIYTVTGEHDFQWTVEKVATATAAIIGFAFAWWRAAVADKQAQIAQRRADTAESGLNIDRFQKGAELLREDSVSTWYAGLQTLRDLALADPKGHYRQAVEQICEFLIRHSRKRRSRFYKAIAAYERTTTSASPDRNNEGDPSPDAPPTQPEPEGVGRLMMEAIRILSDLLANDVARNVAALPEDPWPELKHVNFRNGVFFNLYFKGADLTGSDFTDAWIIDTSFDDVVLENTNFTRTRITTTNLKGALFDGANFSDTRVHANDSTEPKFSGAIWCWEGSYPSLTDFAGNPTVGMSVSVFPANLRDHYERNLRTGPPEPRPHQMPEVHAVTMNDE